MTGTSIDLAIKNLTTVERLRAKTVIHIMAIRKPPGTQTYQTGNAPSQNAPYREITYPLDADSNSRVPPFWELPARSGDEQLAQNARLSNLINDQTPLTEGDIFNRPRTDSYGRNVNGELDLSARNNSSLPEFAAGVTSSKGVHQTGAELSQHYALGTQPPPQKSRDFQASRTFAIVHSLKTGDNPWDLGNAILNVKTVMGNTILDWFLPTASPCSNHESTESQFAIGPAVERLRAEYGLSVRNGVSGATNGWEETNPRTVQPFQDENTYTEFHNGDQSSGPSSESIKLQTLAPRA
jgi:palmitoyltransferase